MTEKNMGQKFRLKEIDRKRNYFSEEKNPNELIRQKHKKNYKILNYTKHLLILASTATGCVSVSDFACLVGIPVGIGSSPTTINICVMTAGIKNYKLTIKKKKKKHDKIVFLAKTNLNTIEDLISKALINSNISHDEFVSINNVLKEHNDIKRRNQKL